MPLAAAAQPDAGLMCPAVAHLAASVLPDRRTVRRSPGKLRERLELVLGA